MTPPKFLFFDLGNVLLRFDHRRMCRQIADVANVAPERIWDTLFDSGLEVAYESGRISSQQFLDQLCQALGAAPDRQALMAAFNDIFELNTVVMPIVSSLAAARYRLGILSNTNQLHWDFFLDGRFTALQELFAVRVASFQARAMKPDRAIFEFAAARAGVALHEMFFTDDIEANVAGARAVGIDAVPFTTAAQLADDLRQRGIGINY